MTTETEPNATVTVYTRPGCPYSLKLRTKLRLRGVRYRTVNIWQDRDAAEAVRAVAGGHETVPTVNVGDAWLVNPTVRAVITASRGAGLG